MSKTDTLSVRKAAQVLGCTRKFVFDLLYEERLQGATKVGREWRIPIKAIEARLKRQEVRNG